MRSSVAILTLVVVLLAAPALSLTHHFKLSYFGSSSSYLRGGFSSVDTQQKEKVSVAFSVISRLVGGTWENHYQIFNGIEFQQGDDRIRYVNWEIHGENECKVLLRTDPDATPITLTGEHIGNGVIKFDVQGLPFEYLFHQVGDDTILISRTEQSSCEDCGQSENKNGTDNDNEKKKIKLDCGTIVLTGNNSCVQTIVHIDGSDLTMLEVIRGERDPI